MSFKKKITYILLIAYFFLSAGVNNYAFCMGLCDNHKTKTILCPCCCNHKVQINKSNERKIHCECSKNQKSPIERNIQSITNSFQDIAYIDNICSKISPVSYLIIFKNITYNKIHPNQILISNKNLEMLRTVILLN